MEIALLLLILLLNAALLVFLLVKSGKKDDAAITNSFATLEKNLERIERVYQTEMSLNRTEVATAVRALSDSLDKRLTDLFETNNQRMDRMRGTVQERLELLQKDNSVKLEQMRSTVDEKLHATLEKRLGESFKLVGDRLELVHKGLGEMQQLATDVGDVKKVLSNVKTRGIWGEMLLGNLIDQVMTSGQYEKNVAVKRGSNDRVEFAIKLPTKQDDTGTVWLPIDSKFPTEDYHRLLAVRDTAAVSEIETANKAFESAIKLQAKSIQSKYINPPETTDFAFLYLPTEGLFAEVTQRPGLQEELQNKYRVIVAGPSTITAILSYLNMAFQTLAIGKRSSEVWAVLATIKNEFGKFGDLLDKTHKKLQEASTTIEEAATKSRSIEKRLDKVTDVPENPVLEVDPAQVIAPLVEE